MNVQNDHDLQPPVGLKPEYDVIVIGSGHAGMTAANRLASLGHDVLLLEQHSKLGGLATWFKRSPQGHIFDVSLHGFPAGMIKSMRKYWSREIADRIRQLEKIRFVNPQFELTTTFSRDDYTRKMVESFGVERSVVEDFFDYTRAMNFYDDDGMTTGELFNKFFPGRNDIVRFLMEPITYANGSSLADPAITYGIVFSNFMSKGVFIFRGGTEVLVAMMRRLLLENGADIRTRALVEKVLVTGNRVTGVVVNGKTVRARAVLSNGNLLSAVEDLAGREQFPREFLKKVDSVRLNNSSCQVYIGIRRGEKLPDIGDLVFFSDRKDFSSEALLDFPPSSRTFSIYYPSTRPHRKPDYTIVQSTNARYEDWSELDEKGYAEHKRFLIENALDKLEKLAPGAREIVDYTEAATPLTFQRYTLHRGGASFGTKFEGLEVSRRMPEYLPGFFHAGSVGIIMSGWLGAVNYGVIAASEVDKYIRQLKVQG